MHLDEKSLTEPIYSSMYLLQRVYKVIRQYPLFNVARLIRGETKELSPNL